MKSIPPYSLDASGAEMRTLPADATTLLREELARRIRANPRYSLRAWARALGISHSLLSLILAGKRAPSKKTILKLAEVLALGPEETRSLLNGVVPPSRIPSTLFRQIDVDTFALISDWYHYAILSLLDTPDARFEAKWMAAKLGIKEIEAKLAMERLQRLKLVNRIGKRWKQTGLPIKVENAVSTSATRGYQKQLLNKALESLENDPIEVRDFSSMTFAMDPGSIPHALKRIREFRRSLMAELEEMGIPKVVYNLTVQIYPVSKNKENV